MRRKAFDKLTPLNQAKRRLREMAMVVTQEQEKANRLSLANDQQAKSIADKNQAIAARDEEIKLQKMLVMRVEAERERIIRLTELFTSIQITPLGTTTTTSPQNFNMPKELRKI